MSKKPSLVSAILMLIAYVIGLPLFIIGIISNGDKILFTIIGILLCGLPTAVVILLTAKKNSTKKSLKGKKFAIFFVGLFLGLIVTPIYVTVAFVATFKKKPEEKVEAEPAAEVVEENTIVEPEGIPVEDAEVNEEK